MTTHIESQSHHSESITQGEKSFEEFIKNLSPTDREFAVQHKEWFLTVALPETKRTDPVSFAINHNNLGRFQQSTELQQEYSKKALLVIRWLGTVFKK